MNACVLEAPKLLAPLLFMADDPGSPLINDKSLEPLSDKDKDPRKAIALLAEDNPADVLLIQEAIEHYQLPIELSVVQNGEEACALFDSIDNDSGASCPDLLLLDLNLPKRNGREVLRRVRAGGKCKDIPVVIITSSDLAQERQDLTRLGATHYFRKPTSFDQYMKVGEIIQEILSGHSIN